MPGTFCSACASSSTCTSISAPYGCSTPISHRCAVTIAASTSSFFARTRRASTSAGVERIIRAAFEWAKVHGKTRVTMSDKANAVPAHRIWQETFRRVGAGFAGIEAEHRYVDALAMELVREPERFQVIVSNNLYGDILSDLGAGLVGGLGLAASANLHPGRAGLFEPVHGSAPPLAGKGIANPMAAVLTGALMFEQLGHPEAALDLEQAVRATLAAGVRTPDIGGTAGTRDVAAAIAARL